MDLISEGIREAISLLVQFDHEVFGAVFRSLWISTFAVAMASLIGLPMGMFLARRSFVGRRFAILLARSAMALPTVFLGIVCYALFSADGPLGVMGIIYTPWIVVCGEFLLALPIVISLGHGAIRSLDRRIGETALTLGARWPRRCWTYVSEARVGVILAVLTAFSRCVTELGIAMLVGGNIKGKTRTLATTTALEISRGHFGRGLAVGLLLLVLAVGVTLVIVYLSQEEEDGKQPGRWQAGTQASGNASKVSHD